MNKRDLLVSAGVTAICVLILVVFTDIEVSFVHLVNCSPLSLQKDRRSPVCR